MQCTLCLNAEANKKGSHIVSQFIVSKMLANKGKARYREIGSTISSRGFSEFTIGRDVTPEKILELFGREMDENDLRNNSNPYVADYFLCTACEDRLQRLEDIVASDFYNKLQNIPQVEKNENKFIRIGEELDSAIRLFFISILWRAAVTKFGDFELPSESKEKLRSLLDRVLSKESSDLKVNLMLNLKEIRSHRLMIMTENPTNGHADKTDNAVNFDPETTTPYFVSINEFVIGYYDNDSKFNRAINGYYGLESIVHRSFFKNEKYYGHILIVPDAKWLGWKGNMVKKFAQRYAQESCDNFKRLFIKVHGHEPSKQKIQEFFYDFVNGSEYTLDKYTLQNFAVYAHKHIIE